MGPRKPPENPPKGSRRTLGTTRHRAPGSQERNTEGAAGTSRRSTSPPPSKKQKKSRGAKPNVKLEPQSDASKDSDVLCVSEESGAVDYSDEPEEATYDVTSPEDDVDADVDFLLDPNDKDEEDLLDDEDEDEEEVEEVIHPKKSGSAAKKPATGKQKKQKLHLKLNLNQPKEKTLRLSTTKKGNKKEETLKLTTPSRGSGGKKATSAVTPSTQRSNPPRSSPFPSWGASRSQTPPPRSPTPPPRSQPITSSQASSSSTGGYTSPFKARKEDRAESLRTKINMYQSCVKGLLDREEGLSPENAARVEQWLSKIDDFERELATLSRTSSHQKPAKSPAAAAKPSKAEPESWREDSYHEEEQEGPWVPKDMDMDDHARRVEEARARIRIATPAEVKEFRENMLDTDGITQTGFDLCMKAFIECNEKHKKAAANEKLDPNYPDSAEYSVSIYLCYKLFLKCSISLVL